MRTYRSAVLCLAAVSIKYPIEVFTLKTCQSACLLACLPMCVFLSLSFSTSASHLISSHLLLYSSHVTERNRVKSFKYLIFYPGINIASLFYRYSYLSICLSKLVYVFYLSFYLSRSVYLSARQPIALFLDLLFFNTFLSPNIFPLSIPPLGIMMCLTYFYIKPTLSVFSSFYIDLSKDLYLFSPNPSVSYFI